MGIDIIAVTLINGISHCADYAKVEVNSSVLIVGSGLTMADAVISLHKNGHQGRLTAISRRGIIPTAHDTSKSESIVYSRLKNNTSQKITFHLSESSMTYCCHPVAVLRQGSSS